MSKDIPFFECGGHFKGSLSVKTGGKNKCNKV